MTTVANDSLEREALVYLTPDEWFNFTMKPNHRGVTHTKICQIAPKMVLEVLILVSEVNKEGICKISN